MAAHPGYSIVAVGLSRVYFLLGGLGSIVVGSLLIFAQTGLPIWVAFGFLIVGFWSVAFAFLAKKNSVADAARESIDSESM
jgi:hypothetical protein